MKLLSTFLVLFFSFLGNVSAQEMMYDKYLHPYPKTVQSHGDLTVAFDQRVSSRYYNIKGHGVVEYYTGDGQFVGFYGDKSKFDIMDLPFIKKNRNIKHLLKDHDLDEALLIYFHPEKRKELKYPIRRGGTKRG